jgi:hypothetical protein
MELCNPSCATAITQPDWGAQCNQTKRKGGIVRVGAKICDPDFEFTYPDGLENIDNWRDMFCKELIKITGPVVGQQGAGSVSKRRTSSCGPEKPISRTDSVTWQDFNADTNLLDFDFYNDWADNVDFSSFFYIDCNDLVYMYDGSYSLEISEVKEDQSETGLSYKQGTVTMIGENQLLKPISVPGILAFFQSLKIDDCYS